MIPAGFCPARRCDFSLASHRSLTADIINFRTRERVAGGGQDPAAEAAAALQRAQDAISEASERGALSLDNCYDLAEVIEQTLTPEWKFQWLVRWRKATAVTGSPAKRPSEPGATEDQRI